MFDVVSTVDQDVINVDNDADIKEGLQDVLDQSLECCWSIGESEGHDFVLEMAIPGSKCGFLNVILVDLDLIVSPAKVNFGEDRSSL